MKKLTLLPHSSGPWLARVGNRNFSIPADLGRALLPMQGESLDLERVKGLLPEDLVMAEAVLSWSDPLAPDANQWHTQRTIWGRMSLVPEPMVQKIAGRLIGLASTRTLALMGVVGGLCYGVFFLLLASGLTGNQTVNVVVSNNLTVVFSGLVLFLLSGIWHELGHAAALAREGYAPGRIGLGFLLVIPVLFAEVTAVGMLKRKGRLRVDSSGMVFQLLAGGLMLVLSLLFASRAPLAGALQVGGISSLVAVLWSMLPFVRSDGYWILADYLEVENLDVPWRESGSESRFAGWFMVLFRVANVGFLIFLGAIIPLRLVHWLRFLGWWPGDMAGLGAIVLQVLLYCIFCLIWIGLGRHGLKLGQASWRDVRDLKLFGK